MMGGGTAKKLAAGRKASIAVSLTRLLKPSEGLNAALDTLGSPPGVWAQ